MCLCVLCAREKELVIVYGSRREREVMCVNGSERVGAVGVGLWITAKSSKYKEVCCHQQGLNNVAHDCLDYIICTRIPLVQ